MPGFSKGENYSLLIGGVLSIEGELHGLLDSKYLHLGAFFCHYRAL